MKFNFVATLLGALLIAAVLGAFSLIQVRDLDQNAIMPAAEPDRRPIPPGTEVDPATGVDAGNSPIVEVTPSAPAVGSGQLGQPAGATPTGPSGPRAVSTASPYLVYLPLVAHTPAPIYLPLVVNNQPPAPTPIATKPEPPAVTPAAGWPDGRASQTGSKLGLHVVRNNDPYIMEYVRRVRPRVMKSVDDLGWLSDVKLASPNTVTIGRISGQNEDWPEEYDPEVAAQMFIAQNMTKYRLNPGVDYWEGWNEFVPVTEARWRWYAAFEAARACQMQALGLHAAIGGFAAGTPEYNQMPYFLPALQAAHRCGAIFTLHEGVSPIPGCGVFIDEAGIIPGAPTFPGVLMGYIMLRYRFWYEGYLKPLGLGDVPLVISELAVGGIVPGSPCNGPGGSGWKGYSSFWVLNGVGPTGAQAWANLLAGYDAELRKDPYVFGTTIFTAGALDGGPWYSEDLHDVIIPLANYETVQP